MLEVLEFIFRDVQTFIGTVVLMLIVVFGLSVFKPFIIDITTVYGNIEDGEI